MTRPDIGDFVALRGRVWLVEGRAVPVEGIEIRSFPAEIARLALIIAEFQCNVLYRGQREAVFDILPLDQTGHIHCANALRTDWLEVCPPQEAGGRFVERDLAGPTGRLNLEGAGRNGDGPIETYVCGNPPYKGSQTQQEAQKNDLGSIFEGRAKSWKQLDYVAGWFMKATDYGAATGAKSAFVATNSICQGRAVPILWPLIFKKGSHISFAHTSFRWRNLASRNAGVTVVVVGLSGDGGKIRRLFSPDENGETVARKVDNISAYLVPGENVIVVRRSKPLSDIADMHFGNMPIDDGHLLLSAPDVQALGLAPQQRKRLTRRIHGSQEFIRGLERYCLWIRDEDLQDAQAIPAIAARIERVRQIRRESSRVATQELAAVAHRFGSQSQRGNEIAIVVPSASSETRP